MLSQEALQDWLLSEITPPKKGDLSIADEGRGSLDADQPSNGVATSRGASPMNIDPLVRHIPSNAITCEHGNLDPKRVGNMKRITKVCSVLYPRQLDAKGEVRSPSIK